MQRYRVAMIGSGAVWGARGFGGIVHDNCRSLARLPFFCISQCHALLIPGAPSPLLPCALRALPGAWACSAVTLVASNTRGGGRGPGDRFVEEVRMWVYEEEVGGR